MIEFLSATIFLWILPMLLIWALIKIASHFEATKYKDFRFFFDWSFVPIINWLFIMTFIIVIMIESKALDNIYKWLTK